MRIDELYESMRYLMLSLEPHKLDDNRVRDAIYRELDDFRCCINNPNLLNEDELDQYEKSCQSMKRLYRSSHGAS